MSFVGKILVVVQLVLSVLFMALAGAVFSVHTNWKAKHEAQAVLLEGEKKNVATAQAELAAVRQASQKIVDDNKAQMGNLTQQVATQTIELAALTKKNNEDQLELQTQTAIATTKTREAIFRTTEADEQRAANRTLQIALDTTAASMRQIEDDKFALQIEHDNLKDLHLASLEKLAYLEKVVRKHGIETDPLIAEKMDAPPPPVDGLVSEVKKDNTNRPKMITITVGEDDGLLKGNVMSVMRSGVGGKKPQYLGQVRIIVIAPNSAVCEVVESAKNGIIEVGDNVTTKL
jgi:hypothetical protein